MIIGNILSSFDCGKTECLIALYMVEEGPCEGGIYLFER